MEVGVEWEGGAQDIDNMGCSGLPAGEKVLQDDEFTCDLFRFLQLLCEGHNSGSWDPRLSAAAQK